MDALSISDKLVGKNRAKAHRLLALSLLLILVLAAAVQARAQSPEVLYFSETGHNLYGAFLQQYRRASDPLLLYGYPITEQFTGKDGKVIQYFQRARFELDLNQQIRLTNIGAELYAPAGQLNVYQPSGCQYFPATDFWVCFDFLEFFNRHGGVAQFGNPLSPFEYHDGLIVQYFEKARFEWRPQMVEGQKVALSDLGRIYFDRLGEDPALLAPVPLLNAPPASGQPTLPPPTPIPASPTPTFDYTQTEYFTETGHTLSGLFRQHYRSTPDPLLVYGYPITEQFTSRDGQLVQYFQRARFELHPGLPPGQQIQLTRIGAALYVPAGRLNVYNPAECSYFPETGFWICFDFLEFFNQHGGVAQFGYPISPFEFQNASIVQYFEKARFEWQAFAPGGQTVTLGNLGRMYFDYLGEDPALLAPLPLPGASPTPQPPPTESTTTATMEPSLTVEPTATPAPSETPPAEPTSTSSATPTGEPSAAPTFVPSETPASSSTPTLTPSPAASLSPTPTLAPTMTASATASRTPTPAVLRGTVIVDQANCRYGPGAGYLYKYGLYKGNRLEIIGRNELGTWVYVQAIGGHNPCWVKASLMEINGNVMGLPYVVPVLPKSPYYGPPTGVYAARNGDRVEISWNAVILRAGDSSEQYDYLVEAWVCQAGQLVFTPIGTNELAVIVTDEAGCAEPSHGRVYTSEKHGYSIPPAEVRWPPR